MYINSGAIYVHSATDVLTVRGNKQLYIRGGIASGVRGSTDTLAKISQNIFAYSPLPLSSEYKIFFNVLPNFLIVSTGFLFIVLDEWMNRWMDEWKLVVLAFYMNLFAQGDGLGAEQRGRGCSPPRPQVLLPPVLHLHHHCHWNLHLNRIHRWKKICTNKWN